MSSNELSVTWDDHHCKLVGVFEKLLERNSLVDCTIAAEGQYLKAHKVILSACSPYFELLFSQENDKNPIIVLKDVKFQELKFLIDFIYRGKVKIPENDLGDFVSAAESLQINGLWGDHKKNVTSKKKVEEQVFTHRRKSVSPIPRKRKKNSSLRTSDENINKLINIDNESNSNENISQDSENSETVPTSLAYGCNLSIMKTTSHSDLLSSDIQNQTSCANTSLLLTSSSTEGVAQLAQTNIKKEPEEIVQAFVPENDHLELKMEEEYRGELPVKKLGERMVERNSAAVLCEQSSSQYSTVISSALQREDGESRDGFARSQMAESINTQGIPLNLASESRITSEPLLPILQHQITPAISSTIFTRGSSFSAVLADKAALIESRSLGSWQGIIRRFPCPVCSKTFSTPSEVKRHLRIHTGERPFKCQLCCQSFTQSGHLSHHMKVHKVNEEDRPFKCQDCDKSFRVAKALEFHQRQHDGHRYECEICGKLLGTADDCVIHQKLHMRRRKSGVVT